MKPMASQTPMNLPRLISSGLILSELTSSLVASRAPRLTPHGSGYHNCNVATVQVGTGDSEEPIGGLHEPIGHFEEQICDSEESAEGSGEPAQDLEESTDDSREPGDSDGQVLHFLCSRSI